MSKKKYSNDMEMKIVEEYLNGVSTRSLMEKYNFKTRKSITDKVKKYGYRVRSSREEVMMHKPYEYFSMEIIDSEFKAYFLGLLLTDGYIVHNTVGLDLTDEDCIKFISSTIQKPYKSYNRDGNRKIRHRLIINNPKLVSELKRFGIINRKTKTLQGFVLEENEQKYIPYIIRGMIDGDGWITKSNKSSTLTIGFISNKKMLEDIKEHNINHPKFKYNPNYREDFIKSVSGLRIKNEEDNLP